MLVEACRRLQFLRRQTKDWEWIPRPLERHPQLFCTQEAIFNVSKYHFYVKVTVENVAVFEGVIQCRSMLRKNHSFVHDYVDGAYLIGTIRLKQSVPRFEETWEPDYVSSVVTGLTVLCIPTDYFERQNDAFVFNKTSLTPQLVYASREPRGCECESIQQDDNFGRQYGDKLVVFQDKPIDRRNRNGSTCGNACAEMYFGFQDEATFLIGLCSDNEGRIRILDEGDWIVYDHGRWHH